MKSAANTTENVFELLSDRGLIAQSTDAQMGGRLAQPVVVYNGFDPTADSLHVGHMVPIMGLAWMQRCGHQPIAVVGGATALVGDPSGKSEARKMLDLQQVAANADAIKQQLSRFIQFGDGPGEGKLVNNADWLAGKSWIDMLREIGPHFSVNRMLTMDSVKSRLASAEAGGDGISFLEFNYMVMQAYDFLHLHQTLGCTLQTGGQDQWGNIVMGIELGRRIAGADLAGLTFPLVTKSDGGKFGKTESGAVWLDADRTSPYEFFQFFRNTADADVGKYLAYFTFLPNDQVREYASLQGAELNDAKQVLAYEVTKLVHGKDEADQALDSAKRAFGQARDVTGDAIPNATIDASQLEQGVGLLDLLVQANLAKSKSEARRLVQGGGIRIAGEKVSDPLMSVTHEHVTDGYVLVQAGKKRLFRYDVSS